MRGQQNSLEVVISLLIAVSVFALLLISSNSALQSWINRWQSALGSLMSAVLTLSLVVLYYQQKQINKINQQPEVEVDRVRVLPDEEEYFEFEISNVGKGVASNLKAEILPQVDHDDFVASMTEHPIQRNWEDSDWIVAEDNYLKPGESQISFVVPVTMNVENKAHTFDTSEYPWSFDFTTEQLSKRGVDRLRFKIHITFEDPFGDVHRALVDKDSDRALFDYVVPINGRTALSAAFERGMTFEQCCRDPTKLDEKIQSLPRNTSSK